MAKLPRVTQSILASTGGEVGVFGSAQANGGPGTISANIATIMSLPAWQAGWQLATEGSSKFPCLEEMNGVDFVVTQQLAYLFQQGIPEYDAGTTYYANSLCMAVGTTQLYASVTNGNQGNSLGNPTYWTLLADLSLIGATELFTGGISTGSANAQVVTPLTPSSGFTPTNGQTVAFTAGFTNTTALTLNFGGTGIKNTYVNHGSGPVLTTGGEVQATDSVFATYNSSLPGYVITSSLPLGTAANKAASDNTKATVASVSGATVTNNFISAADTVGTSKDSGFGSASILGAGVGFAGGTGVIGRATNVASITRTAAGHYDIVYTSSLANGANPYISVGFTNPGSGISWAITAQSTTGISIQTYNLTGSPVDPSYVCVTIFAN